MQTILLSWPNTWGKRRGKKMDILQQTTQTSPSASAASRLCVSSCAASGGPTNQGWISQVIQSRCGMRLTFDKNCKYLPSRLCLSDCCPNTLFVPIHLCKRITSESPVYHISKHQLADRQSKIRMCQKYSSYRKFPDSQEEADYKDTISFWKHFRHFPRAPKRSSGFQ